MKKLALILAIVLGLGMASFADNSGLFGRGRTVQESKTDSPNTGLFPTLPVHNLVGNQPATPLGSGVVVLLGLGAAYAVAKKRREE